MFNPNHVSITVVSARNLTGKGKNGKNDAFVVIQLGDKKFQTSIQKKSVAPCWEEECEFFYENKFAELILTVYHRNLLGFDEFLGQIRLPLDEICEPPKSLNPNQRPPNRWFPLKGKSGKNDEHKSRGDLEIRLQFSRQQQPNAVQQNPPRSKSPSISSFTTGRQDSGEGQKTKEKTSTLPLRGNGLKKKDFMGSMPSLIGGGAKLSRPPSPTGSIASVSKKKSLFSKLKSSTSFHHHKQARVGEPDGISQANPEEFLTTTASIGDQADGAIASGRKLILEPLSEKISHDFEDDQPNATISPEPDDPQPVIKKRGGGVFTIGGGGNKQRPASAIIQGDRSNSALQNRFAMSFDSNTGMNGTQSTSAVAIVAQSSSTSDPHKDLPVNASSAKEGLLGVINDQRLIIARQRVKIRELEDYIDNLLLRVMATQPELLSVEDATKKRAGSAPHNGKRNSFSFGFRK